MINDDKNFSFAQIEQLIQKSTPLETILESTQFRSAWGSSSQILFDFLSQNIILIFEFSIRTKPTSIFALDSCNFILQTKNITFLNMIFKRCDFTQYIQDFIYSIQKYDQQVQSLFFDQIAWLISNSSFLFFNYINFSTFFFSLVNSVYLDPTFRFLSSFVSNFYSDNFSYFEPIEVPKVLLNKYLSDRRSVNSHQCVLLFIFCLEDDQLFSRHAAKLILANSLHNIIIHLAFNENDTKCVDLIRILLIKSLKHANNENWQEIGKCCIDNIDIICMKLSKMTTFGKYEKLISIIFIIIVEEKTIMSSDVYNVVKRCIELFFVFPLNSFLHSFTVYAIELFIQNDGRIEDLIVETCLISLIIQKYQNINYFDSVYWGHLRLISFMVDSYVDPNLFPLWKSLVMKVNSKNQVLIEQKTVSYQIFANRMTVPVNPNLIKMLQSPQTRKYVILTSLTVLFILFVIIIVY